MSLLACPRVLRSDFSMMDEQLEPNKAKEMIKGQTDSLDSSFHLSYNMVLNLLRVEDQNPLKKIARSFLQFQNTRKAPRIQTQLEEVQAQRDAIDGTIRDTKGVSRRPNSDAHCVLLGLIWIAILTCAVSFFCF